MCVCVSLSKFPCSANSHAVASHRDSGDPARVFPLLGFAPLPGGCCVSDLNMDIYIYISQSLYSSLYVWLPVGGRRQALGVVPLLHAATQHLVGGDEHHADDEGDGEGADEALPHAGLPDLLAGAGWGRRGEPEDGGVLSQTPNPPVPVPQVTGTIPVASGLVVGFGIPGRLALTLNVDGAFLGRAHVALLLRHDDVLDVLHGEVLAEGVVQQPLQLVHRQLLHVALRGAGRGARVWGLTPTVML